MVRSLLMMALMAVTLLTTASAVAQATPTEQDKALAMKWFGEGKAAHADGRDIQTFRRAGSTGRCQDIRRYEHRSRHRRHLGA